MTNDNPTPWNGIPDEPHESGWHWIGYPKRMEPFFWSAEEQAWTDGIPAARPTIGNCSEYLGPCKPPASRRGNGLPRVAILVKFDHDYDEINIRMNDGTTHYINGWFWKDGDSVFEIVGKTIPQINAAAEEFRRRSHGEAAE